MTGELGFLISIGLLFSAVVILVSSVFLPAVGERQVKKSLDMLSVYDTGVVSERDIVRIHLSQRALIILSKLAKIGRRLSPVRFIDYYNRQLVYAGLAGSLDRLMAAKMLSLIGCGALAFVLYPLSRWGLILPLVGFFIPDVWLVVKARVRQKAIRLNLPGVLDLLAVSVEAGLGFDASLTKVIKNINGPLPEEFARTLKEIQMGSSRKDAFRNLGERTSVPELRSFLGAIIQADIFGISIADTLKIQAQEMRVRRRQKAEEIAQKAPVKLVFPTVLCIFPALFVVLLGPAAIRIYNSVIVTGVLR